RHASASDEAGAFEQLVRYTREVYDKQHNRRFAWGLTICGLDLRVCVFGANYILASEKFDLKAESGRRQFVRMLVYWSFCEEHRLGYDPTVRRLKKLGCWEIDVPILGNPGPCSKANARVDTFYSNTVIISADRQFGRLTRCFLAGREKPSNSESVKHIKHQVIIKDAWPEAEMDASNDMRDEVAHLSKIQRLMPDSSNASGAFPALEAGGRVCFSHDPRLRGSDDRAVEDNTRSLIGEIFDAINESEGGNREAEKLQMNGIPYRVHKRIATSPIGEPLRRLESILELVIVVADAMRAHTAILKSCRILHRDISNNNIMFYRTEDGMAKGLLIDFDHAIDHDQVSRTYHQQRSGTLPFMSVNNLENNDNERTALDDWESLIYLLCWIGTFGLRSDHANNQETQDNLRIGRWTNGNLDSIADAKRSDLDSDGQFARITRQFYDKSGNIAFLAKLVEKLRYVLIESGPETNCKGSVLKKPAKSDSSLPLMDEQRKQHIAELLKGLKTTNQKQIVVESIDPFKERVKHASNISKYMMEILGSYAETAKLVLGNGFADFPVAILDSL
ncbi:hypothetical protein LPJ75_004436, partial [Coemansia sp. RSA 2598]